MLSPALGAALQTFVEELADLIAYRVVHRLQQGTPDMVDQTTSPLGRRRHCYAVRRRISEHQTGAAVVGRRHLLTQEALAEELTRLGMGNRRPTTERPRPSGESVADELRRELGLLHEMQAQGASKAEINAFVRGRPAPKSPRAAPTSRESSPRKTPR